MSSIHPTAILGDGATIGANCSIGAYCVIGDQVSLGEGAVLAPHAVIQGDVDIGTGVEVGSFTSIGTPAQHVRVHEQEPGRVAIGANTKIREHVTINAGMLSEDRTTRIGENCFIMVGSHVGHDCQVGDEVIMTNNATLAGHVEVGRGAILGGLCAVHQFARIGSYAFIGGMSGVEFDVIPYAMAVGNRARLEGFNVIGLKRRGVSRADIKELRAAYDRLFFGGEPLAKAVAAMKQEPSENALLSEILEFLSADSKRRYCVPDER